MDKVSNIIIVFSHLPIFATAAYALLKYRELSRELRAFSLFLFLSAAIQSVSLLFWFYGINNLPLLHLYVATGFVSLAWFYVKVLHGFIDQSIIWTGTLIFLLFTIANSLFLQDIWKFNSYALTAESVLIVILSLFTFTVLLNDLVREVRPTTISSINWINSGLFIYYSSSLLIFYFGEMITHKFSRELSRYTWVLHSFFSMVMYSCFFVGLWKRPRS